MVGIQEEMTSMRGVAKELKGLPAVSASLSGHRPLFPVWRAGAHRLSLPGPEPLDCFTHVWCGEHTDMDIVGGKLHTKLGTFTLSKPEQALCWALLPVRKCTDTVKSSQIYLNSTL